ncbi:hypothetical protein T484DRAFT_1971283 [Baffinella frigidus]|nr:hypothetical protein T484DRAFT_1971283 [Cryptophyta sp. CCMP2293]
MPKKESQKERAAGKAEAASAAADNAAEDASWNDGGGKKGGKKEGAEEKRVSQLAAKAERDAMEAEETAGLTPKKKVEPKKTQFEIKQAMFSVPPSKKDKKKREMEPEVQQNANHLARDQEQAAAASGKDLLAASGVNDALKALSTGGGESPVDAHPERRRKAAYSAYEEREIPRLREENKGLKLSQIKEIIFKSWQKSPENPVNQTA